MKLKPLKITKNNKAQVHATQGVSSTFHKKTNKHLPLHSPSFVRMIQIDSKAVMDINLTLGHGL